MKATVIILGKDERRGLEFETLPRQGDVIAIVSETEEIDTRPVARVVHAIYHDGTVEVLIETGLPLQSEVERPKGL